MENRIIKKCFMPGDRICNSSCMSFRGDIENPRCAIIDLVSRLSQNFEVQTITHEWAGRFPDSPEPPEIK